MSISMIASVSLAVWGVFLYNQTVNLRYEIADYEKAIQQAEVSNAELKNNLYQIIDSKNFEAFSGSSGLVLDKNPEFVKTQSLAANN
ncbi:hypothetical protein HZC33_03295 [Candidatus Wolfebacteria bacterium]|nr:hypothetical protein [Candidatus Wolfebacteria bacterium]